MGQPLAAERLPRSCVIVSLTPVRCAVACWTLCISSRLPSLSSSSSCFRIVLTRFRRRFVHCMIPLLVLVPPCLRCINSLRCSSGLRLVHIRARRDAHGHITPASSSHRAYRVLFLGPLVQLPLQPPSHHPHIRTRIHPYLHTHLNGPLNLRRFTVSPSSYPSHLTSSLLLSVYSSVLLPLWPVGARRCAVHCV